MTFDPAILPQNLLELKGTAPKWGSQMFMRGVSARVGRSPHGGQSHRRPARVLREKNAGGSSGEGRTTWGWRWQVVCNAPAPEPSTAVPSTLVAGSRQEGPGKWKKEEEGWQDGGEILLTWTKNSIYKRTNKMSKSVYGRRVDSNMDKWKWIN